MTTTTAITLRTPPAPMRRAFNRSREPYSPPACTGRRTAHCSCSCSTSPAAAPLLHLPTWADRRRTFERVAASLRPGGRFAWNAFAFDHQIATCLDGEYRDEPVPQTNRYPVGDKRIDIILAPTAPRR